MYAGEATCKYQHHWILITAFNKHAIGNGILQLKFRWLAQQAEYFMAIALSKLSISVQLNQGKKLQYS